MGQSSRKERLTDKDSSARGRDNPEERKPEGTEIPGGTGKGLEKEHSTPGPPARPRGTRVLPPAGARHHGRSILGWPKAEMDAQKANTNSSTVDPLLALKTTVLQVREISEPLWTKRWSLKDCPLPAPRLTPATAGPASAAWTTGPTSVAAPAPPGAVSRHVPCRSPAKAQLQPRSSEGPKRLMLGSNVSTLPWRITINYSLCAGYFSKIQAVRCHLMP